MQYGWPRRLIYWRATLRRATMWLFVFVCVCVLLPCVWMRWSIFAVTCLAFFTSLAMSSPFIRSSCLSSITTLELLGTLGRHAKDGITFRLCFSPEMSLCPFGDMTNNETLNFPFKQKLFKWFKLVSTSFHFRKDLGKKSNILSLLIVWVTTLSVSTSPHSRVF